MSIPITSTDPCFDTPLPSAPTPGLDLDRETSTSLVSYITLPLTHPTTFTFLFSALFFVLTVIPVTVCLSLSLARHRHNADQAQLRRLYPAEDGTGDAGNGREGQRVLSVWRIPFGSPVYYIDRTNLDNSGVREENDEFQSVTSEKANL